MSAVKTNLIDLNFQGFPGAIGMYAIDNGDELTLIELGPASTLEAVERGLADLGRRFDEVSHVFLTHLHLDHAGGAGVLAQRNPNITFHLHAGAAPVLADPTPLIASARRSFGDRLERLWGDVLGVPDAQIVPVNNGDRFDVSGTTIEVVATPGHAGTHVAYFDHDSGYLFTGDSAGARLQGSDVVVPTLAPPDLNFDAWRSTIERLQQLPIQALALTHFGLFEDVQRHLSEIIPGIESSERLAADVLHSPRDMDALDEAIQQRTRRLYEAEGGDVEHKVNTMQFGMPAYLGAQGLVRMFTKDGRIS